MKNIRKNFLWVFVFSFAISTFSYARNLEGRLGLGYNAQFSNSEYQNGVPSLSVKYAFLPDIAGQFILGFNTGTPSNSTVGIKFLKNIFMETNLNFYFSGGVGLLKATRTGSTVSETGVEFRTGLGAEFFIPGIESLGISFEAGLALSNISGSFAFQTFGDNFLAAGMHFYF